VSVVSESEVFLIIFILCGYVTGRNNSERHNIGLSWMGKEIKERNRKIKFIVYLKEIFRQKCKLDLFIF